MGHSLVLMLFPPFLSVVSINSSWEGKERLDIYEGACLFQHLGVETGGLEVQVQPQLNSEVETSLASMKHFLKTKQKKQILARRLLKQSALFIRCQEQAPESQVTFTLKPCGYGI